MEKNSLKLLNEKQTSLIKLLIDIQDIVDKSEKRQSESDERLEKALEEIRLLKLDLDHLEEENLSSKIEIKQLKDIIGLEQ